MKFPGSVIIISDEVSQDLPVVSAFVREFKLPGIELRSLNGRAFKDLTRADIAEVAKASQADGWKVFGCATPVFKCELTDTAGIAAHREIFKRSLDNARELGADLLRVFTFLRTPNPTEPAKQAQVIEHLRGLLDLAKGSGIRIGVENEHSCLAATADETLAILAPLPAEHFGAIWDPCNVLYVPSAAIATPADLVRLVPRLFHFHVKDALRHAHVAPGTAHIATGVPIGLGEVDWRGQLRALATTSYRGLLSLETHWRVEKIDESLLHLPAGHAFSHGGEAASRTCLHNLRAIMETQ